MLIEANAARVIKAVTNTPLDIPEGAEVIDVCKAVEEMMNESEERGELRMLVKQVRKGRITIEQAAEDANMSVEQFKNWFTKPIESLVGLIFLRFFKFICEKSCPRLDIGRKGLFSEIYEAVSKPLLQYE